MSTPLNVRKLSYSAAIEYFLDVVETAGFLDPLQLRDQLAKGEFFALVPDDASSEQVLRFGTGGLLQGDSRANSAVVREVPNTIPAISAVVATCAQEIDDPVMWLHEPLLSEDEITASWLVPKRVGKSLFLVSAGDNARQPARVAKSLDYAVLSWHLLVFVTDGLHNACTVSTVLERAKMVVAGAYDGESALLWYRT